MSTTTIGHSRAAACGGSLVLSGLLVFSSGCGKSGGESTTPPLAPAQWQRRSENPLLIPPKNPPPATTFEASIADPSVMYDASDGKWKAWYSATIFDTAVAGDPGRMVIKYADSSDGLHWTVQAAPVISARGAATDWDYTQVETPSVVRNPDPAAPAGKRFMLFYSGGNTVTDVAGGRPIRMNYPYYAIGLAWSADGRSFTRDLPGVDGKPGLALKASTVLASVAGYYDGVVADPEAVVKDGQVLLWCSSYAEDAARGALAFGISHARSTTGTAWTFPAANPLASIYKTGELAGGEQPAVLYDADQGRFEMWYKNDTTAERLLIPTDWFTAYGFWHATSSDGIAWTPDYSKRDFAWEGAHDYETYGLLTGCSVVRRDGIDRMFYCAWGTHGIPDPLYYQLPLRTGSTVPAVITFDQAFRQTPAAAPSPAVPASVARRKAGAWPPLAALFGRGRR